MDGYIGFSVGDVPQIKVQHSCTVCKT